MTTVSCLMADYEASDICWTDNNIMVVNQNSHPIYPDLGVKEVHNPTTVAATIVIVISLNLTTCILLENLCPLLH